MRNILRKSKCKDPEVEQKLVLKEKKEDQSVWNAVNKGESSARWGWIGHILKGFVTVLNKLHFILRAMWSNWKALHLKGHSLIYVLQKWYYYLGGLYFRDLEDYTWKEDGLESSCNNPGGDDSNWEKSYGSGIGE